MNTSIYGVGVTEVQCAGIGVVTVSGLMDTAVFGVTEAYVIHGFYSAWIAVITVCNLCVAFTRVEVAQVDSTGVAIAAIQFVVQASFFLVTDIDSASALIVASID